MLEDQFSIQDLVNLRDYIKIDNNDIMTFLYRKYKGKVTMENIKHFLQTSKYINNIEIKFQEHEFT